MFKTLRLRWEDLKIGKACPCFIKKYLSEYNFKAECKGS